MAKRLTNHYKRSSDCDNNVNIRSLLRLNRRSLRPASVASTVLFFMIAFSSMVSVRSFNLSPSSKQGHHLHSQSSSLTSPIKRQQPLHTKLDAIAAGDNAENSSTSNDEILSTTTNESLIISGGTDDGYDGLGEYDPSENLPQTEREVPNVGDPQLRVKEKDWSVTNILKELAAIQQQGPQKYCILGTRHCSYLHQQIIELLYVLSFGLDRINPLVHFDSRRQVFCCWK